jgi:hypothetical protein
VDVDEGLRPDILQQLTRRRKSNGQEEIQGTARVPFAMGQRTAIEHLVFCPMLATVPIVTVAPLNDSHGAARATHVYRYGARLEIKLSEPCDEPCSMLVRYKIVG